MWYICTYYLRALSLLIELCTHKLVWWPFFIELMLAGCTFDSRYLIDVQFSFSDLLLLVLANNNH